MALLMLGTASSLPRGVPSAAVDAPAESRSATSVVILDADPQANWFAVFAPDGKKLASTGMDGTLRFWDRGATMGSGERKR